MRMIDKIKSKSLNDFAAWLDKIGQFEDSPWLDWFDENYCSKCESEFVNVKAFGRCMECAYCEVHNKCRFFQEMDHTPNGKEMVKMWLESEA